MEFAARQIESTLLKSGMSETTTSFPHRGSRKHHPKQHITITISEVTTSEPLPASSIYSRSSSSSNEDLSSSITPTPSSSPIRTSTCYAEPTPTIQKTHPAFRQPVSVSGTSSSSSASSTSTKKSKRDRVKDLWAPWSNIPFYTGTSACREIVASEQEARAMERRRKSSSYFPCLSGCV